MAAERKGRREFPPTGVTVVDNCPLARNPKAGMEQVPCRCLFCHGPMYHQDTRTHSEGDVIQCTCPECGATCIASPDGASWVNDWDRD